MILGQKCVYWMSCYSKTRQQDGWLRTWLLGIWRCKEVIMLVCPLHHERESLPLPFGLVYISTMKNKIEVLTLFTGSPPNSIFCLLFLSSIPTPLFRNFANKSGWIQQGIPVVYHWPLTESYCMTGGGASPLSQCVSPLNISPPHPHPHTHTRSWIMGWGEK